MLKDEEIGKERQGGFSSHLCFKYLFCMCAGPLASALEKGTSNMKWYKITEYYADCSWCFYVPLSHPAGGDREAALLGHSPCPVLSPVWQWLVLDTTRGTGGLLEQHFSSPTGWAASSEPAQNCQSLGGDAHSSAKPPYPGKKGCKHGQPSFPWSQAAFLPLCPSRHLNFCGCWSSFQSCGSISAVPLLKIKYNQDRLFFKKVFQR